MNETQAMPVVLEQAAASAVEVDGLGYAYKKRPALSGVTFAVRQQSIHGFVGPNGAGKTTTLKVLATLLRPQRGTARIFGQDVVRHYKDVRRRIGFMPDHLSMYRQMTVFEYLDFFAAAYGMGRDQRDKVIHDVLVLTDMEARQNDLIKGLSRGMLQRVGLARVLVHDPELLLLDEPASGLDPRARIELMEILKELCRMGKTIFISSHILSELATLCDSVTIIDRGAVRYTGSMSGLLSRGAQTTSYTLTLAISHEVTEQALRSLAGVVEVLKRDHEPAYLVSFDSSKVGTNGILEAAIQAGGHVVSFQQDVRQLNEAFMELTEPGVPS
jgi:ABC-2 type transport system ATP-binding protein